MFTEECQSNNKRRKLISLLYVYVYLVLNLLKVSCHIVGPKRMFFNQYIPTFLVGSQLIMNILCPCCCIIHVYIVVHFGIVCGVFGWKHLLLFVSVGIAVEVLMIKLLTPLIG